MVMATWSPFATFRMTSKQSQCGSWQGKQQIIPISCFHHFSSREAPLQSTRSHTPVHPFASPHFSEPMCCPCWPLCLLSSTNQKHQSCNTYSPNHPSALLLTWYSHLFPLNDLYSSGVMRVMESVELLSLSNAITWHHTLRPHCITAAILAIHVVNPGLPVHLVRLV